MESSGAVDAGHLYEQKLVISAWVVVPAATLHALLLMLIARGNGTTVLGALPLDRSSMA